jgi:murein endopeptidase
MEVILSRVTTGHAFHDLGADSDVDLRIQLCV